MWLILVLHGLLLLSHSVLGMVSTALATLPAFLPSHGAAAS